MVTTVGRLSFVSALWLLVVAVGSGAPGCTVDFGSNAGGADAARTDGGQTDAGDSCGNGEIDDNEECDDGAMNSDIVPNACRSNCMSPWCGDNVIDSGEECDDGPSNSNTLPNACRTSCELHHCGDGIVDTGEACDDGNTTDGDDCRNNCSTANCGDGVLDPGEDCDDGNTSNNDACLNTCIDASCGDAYVWTGQEQCDDGNSTDTDSCTNACQNAVCGDGIVQAGVEACDDGNTNNTDSCVSGCVTATCGDGYVRSGVEQCDDGNSNNTDSCVSGCRTATCGDGYVRSGVEQCDDGDTSNTDGCLNSCVTAECGDGYVRTGYEDCDDSNTTAGDGCSPSCDDENLPELTWLSSTSSGWSTPTVLTFAGETHAPTTPIQASLSIEGAGRAIFFTQSTYHVLRIPQLTWYDSGTQNADFTELPSSGPTGGYGLEGGGGISTTLTLIAGHWAYLFEYTHSSGNITFTLSDDINTNQDWSTPEAPDPNLLTAMYVDLNNDHGWVNDTLITACGTGSGFVQGHSISLTSSSLHLQELGNCFDFYDQMSYTAFPPFSNSVSGVPTLSSIKGLFYYENTNTLYAVTQ